MTASWGTGDRLMSEGLSFFDFGDFPGTWRTVLRYVMRHNPAPRTEVHAALVTPHMSASELDSVLQILCDEGYLTPDTRDNAPIFRLNVARKSINRAVNQQIWNALGLENMVEPATEEPMRRGGRRKLDVAIWDLLDTSSEPAAPERKPKHPVTTRLWDTVTKPTAEPPSEPKIPAPTPRRRSMWDTLDDDSKSDV